MRAFCASAQVILSSAKTSAPVAAPNYKWKTLCLSSTNFETLKQLPRFRVRNYTLGAASPRLYNNYLERGNKESVE